MNEPPDKVPHSPIEKADKLGREEWSESAAKKSYRRYLVEGMARAPVARFKPPKNSSEISVNRMDLAPAETMAELGKRNAESNGKSFWGWYILTAGDVEGVGCSVSASPLEDNPHHADIIIPVPLDAEERRDAVIEYARDLAYHAEFRPWGSWSNARP